MITVKKDIERVSSEVLEQFKKVPPSDYGHKLHFNLISSRSVKPVTKVKERFAGQAITVRIQPNDSILVYKALELAKPGDVLVIDMYGEERYACWGEITTRVAQAKGVVAAIVNGPATDSLEIENLQFPVYAKNISPLTTKVYSLDGDINTTVSIDNVVVHPGDIVVGDNDGLLVIPRSEVNSFLEIGQDEYDKDHNRKKQLAEIGVDKYLENLNATLEDKINWV